MKPMFTVFYHPDPESMTRLMGGEWWKEEEELYVLPQENILVDIEDSNQPFHLENYRSRAATQKKCKLCGGVEFHVAQREYFTAVRCVKCKWEMRIHEG